MKGDKQQWETMKARRLSRQEGRGNEIEPQVILALVDFVVLAEFMYIWIWHKVTGVPYPPPNEA